MNDQLTGGVNPEGARFYGLGQGTSEPSGAPLTNSAHCEIASDKITAGAACLSSTTLSPAGVLQELDAKTGTLKQVHPGCFAIGYGRRSDTSDIEPGPIVYCTDGGLYTMKPAGDSKLAKAFASRNEQEIRAQRDGSEQGGPRFHPSGRSARQGAASGRASADAVRPLASRIPEIDDAASISRKAASSRSGCSAASAAANFDLAEPQAPDARPLSISRENHRTASWGSASSTAA